MVSYSNGLFCCRDVDHHNEDALLHYGKCSFHGTPLSTKEIWYGEIKGKFTRTKTIQDEHTEDIFEKWKKREVSKNSWTVPIEVIKEREFDLSPKNPNGVSGEEMQSPEKILAEIEQNQKQVEEFLTSLKNALKT